MYESFAAVARFRCHCCSNTSQLTYSKFWVPLKEKHEVRVLTLIRQRRMRGRGSLDIIYVITL